MVPFSGGNVEKAVIFGGSGFIGTHLIKYLLHNGYDVVNADLRPGREQRADFRLCDVRNEITLEVSSPPDIVVNLAAVHRTPGHPDNEYYDTNVAGAMNILRWCDRVGAQTVCFTSSISVYGSTEQEKDESSPLAASSSYGRSKRLAEQLHDHWLDSSKNRRLVIARPAVVFGPKENGNFTRLARALRRGTFAYPGRDDTIKACGYVSDLVRAIMFMSSRPESRIIFNYCYPKAYTIREICEAFNMVAGYGKPKMIPPQLIDAALITLRLAFGGRPNHSLAPDRVGKLVSSTNIRPAELVRCGFEWETDIYSGLRIWYESSPRDQFI